MEDYVVKDHKRLRRGFTTGSCAAAAARAAALLVFGRAGQIERGQSLCVELVTPSGAVLTLPVGVEEEPRHGEKGGWSVGCTALCSVRKDSGDDPDVTDGALVCARVTLTEDEQGRIRIDGGRGVGRVTKPGLACPVGEAAINPTPRRMIEAEVSRTMEEVGYEGGVLVEISIPAGEELAKKTYNPRLGIEGGISVLGTSGIVEPMSEQALVDTIKVEMNIRKAAGAEYLLITPGNYGETFLKETMKLGDVYTVKCSNFLGEALDYAVELKLRGVLLVAHIGKLVKVAGGIMNTHSRYGDARMEILAAHAARLGASREVAEQLFSCVTTDDAIAVLDRAEAAELRKKTIDSVLERVDFHIRERVRGGLSTGAVMFSNRYGYLGEAGDARELLSRL